MTFAKMTQQRRPFFPESAHTCSWCEKPIEDGYRFFFWLFASGPISMHMACLADWYPRMMKDVWKILELVLAGVKK